MFILFCIPSIQLSHMFVTPLQSDLQDKQPNKQNMRFLILYLWPFPPPCLVISNPLNISVVVWVFSDLNRRVSCFLKVKNVKKKLIFIWFIH